MVRTFRESGILYKAWYFLQTLWQVLMLFIASLFHKDPRNAQKTNSAFLSTGENHNPGGGGGSGGSGGGGPSRPGNDGP